MELSRSGASTTQQGVQVGDVLRLPEMRRPVVFFKAHTVSSVIVEANGKTLLPLREGLVVCGVCTLQDAIVVNFGILPFLHPEHVFWFPLDQFDSFE
ncbi:MAG: hypothetical protein WC444_02245 [Candidatus Paceibacterota bacterium]